MSFNKALLSIKPFIAHRAVSQFLLCFIMVPYNFFIMFSQKKIVWKFHWESRQIEFTNYIRRKCSSFNYWYCSQLLLLHIPRGFGAFVADLTNFASAIFLQWKITTSSVKKITIFLVSSVLKRSAAQHQNIDFHSYQENKNNNASALVLFFSQAVLIFGLFARKTCY